MLVQITPKPLVCATRRTLYRKYNLILPGSRPKQAGLWVLRPASANLKLAGEKTKKLILIERGPRLFRGTVLFQLTLEEGRACPATCPYLPLRILKNGMTGKKFRCYGCNMPYATRWIHGPELLECLAEDLDTFSRRQRRGLVRWVKGFTVRLHVLGDFYSCEYVDFWKGMLAQHQGLRLYGYTHWPFWSEVGRAVETLAAEFPERVAIRRSDGQDPRDTLPFTVDLRKGEAVPQGVVQCPAQTHGIGCAQCGLCLNRFTTIGFKEH